MRKAPVIAKSLLAKLRKCHSQQTGNNLLRKEGYSVRRLGSGLYRVAYVARRGARVFVIKLSRESSNHDNWGGHGFRKAPTIRCGVFEIQHYYKPLTRVARDLVDAKDTEMHIRNCGMDTDGTIVAFDW